MIVSFPAALQAFEVIKPVKKGTLACDSTALGGFALLAPIDLKIGDLIVINTLTAEIEFIERLGFTAWRANARN